MVNGLELGSNLLYLVRWTNQVYRFRRIVKRTADSSQTDVVSG